MKTMPHSDGLGVALLLLVGAALAPPGAAQSCFGKLNGQGVIATPNFYSNNYPGGNLAVSGGGRCQWTLTPAEDMLGNILFNVFDLAPGATLTIYQGTNTSIAPFTQYTGKGPAGGVIRIRGVVTLVFADADLSLNKGFQLAFYSTALPLLSQRRYLADMRSPVCGGKLESAGIVSSPGQPGIYPLNSKCTWTLTSCEAGAQIAVHFTAMDLELNADTVTVLAGQTQYGPYSGSTLPKDIIDVGPITVTFLSDNVASSNTGFALQFSTVSTAVTSTNPLANPGACDALCPTNTTEDPSSHCFAHDDPHILRFDSVFYQSKDDFQKPGVYYLYKHKTAPVSVQAAFQPCITWPNAFCVCAVAVRYCDEVFVQDRCYTKTPVNGQSMKLYKAGSSFAMNVQPRPTGGWTVRLPTGLRVEIDSALQWMGNIDLYDSLVNKDASEGMCRDVYRCGTSSAQYERSYDSWRVPSEESLFTVWKQLIPCQLSKCGGGCPGLPQFPVPNGVLNMADPNVPLEQYSDSNNFLYGTGPDGLRGDSGAAGAAQFRFVAPWTAQRAFAVCYNALQTTPAMQQCQGLLGRQIDLSNDIASCISDIQITGTTDFLITAKQASKTTCLQALKNAGISPASVLALTCPNDCSQNGVCNNGVCSCVAGRYGKDCSVNIAVPPVLTNTTAAANCTANATVSGVCLLQYVYGQTFYALNTGSLTCKITYRAGNGGTPTALNVTVVPATHLGLTVVVCQLPPGKPGEHVTYAISISNNGASYSNNVTTQRTFFAACGQAFVGSGTVLSPNYPSNYPNNVQCIWDFVAATGASVKLTINSFNLENAFDVLRCYDRDQLIDTFTGNLGTSSAPRYYSKQLRCVFTSDPSNTERGFSISFESYSQTERDSCGGSIYDSATIKSPVDLYDRIRNYPNNAYCLWTLTATTGKVLRLHFNEFALENNYDFLKVYTGGSLYASVTGLTVPADYTLQSTAYLVFRSDQSVTAKGFNILITSV